MNKQFGPLALILVLAVMITALVAGIWAVTLPGRVLAQVADAAEAHDLQLTSGGASLALAGGLAVAVHDLKVTSAASGLSGSVTSLTVHGLMPWDSRSLSLDGANFTHTVPVPIQAVTASKTGIMANAGFAFQTAQVTDGRFRIVDDAGVSLFDMASVSGNFAAEAGGAATFNGRGGINGRQTTWRVELESLTRLGAEGSPADIFVAATDVALPFDLQFSGRMRLVQGFELDGRFSSAASDARSFLTFLGFPDVVPLTGALAAEGGVSLSSAGLKLNDLSLTQGEKEGKGRLALSFGRDGYDVEGAIDLAVLHLPSPAATNFWSERNFVSPDFSKLRGDFAFRAQQLAIDGFQMDSPLLALRFEALGASATLSASRGKDQLTATLRTSTREPFPAFSLSSVFALEDAGAFVKAVSGQDFLGGGLSGKAEISALGRSFSELVSTAVGSIEMKMKQGGIKGYALDDLLSVAGTGWRAAPGDKTSGIDAEINATVSDGIAVLDVTGAKIDGTSHAVQGEVDLLRKALALSVTPQGAKRVGVSGLWSQPAFGPDVEGAPLPLPPAASAPSADN